MWKAITAPLIELYRKEEEAGVTLSYAELRRYLVDILLAVAIGTLLVFCACAISVTGDIRALRSAAIQEIATTRAGSFARADGFLEKADDAIVILRAMNKRLDEQLTKVRDQVQQSSKTTEQQTKALTKTTEAVQNTLEQTGDAIQKVADKPAPVVSVHSPEQTPSVVMAPAVPASAPGPVPGIAPEKPVAAPAPESHRGFRRWLSKLWPFSKNKEKTD